MSHRALGPQFIETAKALNLESGDYYHTKVHEVPKRWARDWADGGGEHSMMHEDHGGPDGYVNHLAGDIAQRGVEEPIEVRGNVLEEGHHRVIAAHQAGLTKLPVKYLKEDE